MARLPARGRLRDGVAEAQCSGWRGRVFVSRADDVVVQYVTGPGLDGELSLDHRLAGVPDGLRVGRSVVLTPHGAQLTLRCRYPDSDLAYTGVTVALVHGGRRSVGTAGLRIERAEGLLLLTRVRRHLGELDAGAEAAALASLAGPELEETYETLLARHEATHRPAYERVTFTLDAPRSERVLPGSELLERVDSPALLERLFAAGRYHLLSASGALPPRLTGLWTGEWGTAWSGRSPRTPTSISRRRPRPPAICPR